MLWRSDFCNWSLFNPAYHCSKLWSSEFCNWSLFNPAYHCSKLWSSEFCNWSLCNTVYNCSMMWRSDFCKWSLLNPVYHCSKLWSSDFCNWLLFNTQYITAPCCGGVICAISMDIYPFRNRFIHASAMDYILFNSVFFYAAMQFSMEQYIIFIQQWILSWSNGILHAAMDYSIQQGSVPWCYGISIQ